MGFCCRRAWATETPPLVRVDDLRNPLSVPLSSANRTGPRLPRPHAEHTMASSQGRTRARPVTGPFADGVVAKMGTRMTCSECGAENEPDARFCRACATALGSPPNPDSEMRKVVTVLFSDVTDSTRLGQDLDPESLRRLVSRYFDEMRLVLERHGGVVEKFIGDAVMAVFGVPKVHEDDALRAVRAALEMRDELRRLNGELQRDWGVTLVARTGLNTGEVIAGDPGRGQSFVAGDTVNTASRLEGAA